MRGSVTVFAAVFLSIFFAQNSYGHVSAKDRPKDPVEPLRIHNQQIRRNIELMWGFRDESDLKKAALFLPRLVFRPFEFIVAGQTSQRLLNTGAVFYRLGDATLHSNHQRWKNFGGRLADSGFNVLGDAEGAISDVAAVIKSPMYSYSKISRRIQLCTENLMSNMSGNDLSYEWVAQENPARHIGFLVDQGKWNAGDSDILRAADDNQRGDGVLCTDVPILSNEPEPIVIQRLYSTHETGEYKLWRYNCGAIAKDIAKTVGIGFPLFPNAGIGNEFGMALSQDRRAKWQEKRKEVDRVIFALRDSIYRLEEGKLPSFHMTDSNSHVERTSPEAALQLVISAARGKNSQARAMIKSWFDFEKSRIGELFDESGRHKLRAELRRMFYGVESEGVAWIADVEPKLYELYLYALK